MSKRVCIIGGTKMYENMFTKRGWTCVSNPFSANLMVLTGGADVSPELYSAKKHPKTNSNPTRDKQEQDIYNYFVGKIPFVGICRGAQFLWVMNGGKLYQHVTNHAIKTTHPLYKYTPRTIKYLGQVTSTHHQMMMCNKEELKRSVLAYSRQGGTKEFKGKEDHLEDLDIEVAYFKDTNCLCFQPHPEYRSGDMRDYFFNLIWDYLIQKG